MSNCASLLYPERPFHPLRAIDFFLFCFHELTKPFSSKSRVFSSIQNPRGRGSALNFSTFGHHLPVSSLESVLTPKPPATPLESAFTKKDRGGGGTSFPFRRVPDRPKLRRPDDPLCCQTLPVYLSRFKGSV